MVSQATIKQIKHEYGVDYLSINATFEIIKRIITKKRWKDWRYSEIVKVDETCLSSGKNNKKRVLKNIWCVGGISRETKKMFFELAISRNMINIDTIITKHVDVDTLIMTDCWSDHLNVEEFRVFT
ncbi:hypothetical protein CDIK_1232 [Cucumispora dikerogammari]|nr:hypothetical protein CDIK_1232 [Cucumispora dikerogammari]